MTALPDRPSLGVDAALILDTAHEAFVAMDTDGRIVEWNRAAEQLFGWEREEVVDRELADVIIPERLREAHRTGLRRYFETGTGPVLESRLELPALHRDGHELPVEITISAITAEVGHFFHAFLHDVSERANRDRLMAAQLQVTKVLATAGSDEAPRRVLETLCGAGGWEYGGWWIADSEVETLQGYRAWWNPGTDLSSFASTSRGMSFARGRGLPGLVWETGEPLWHWPVELVADFPRYVAASRLDLHSGLAVPLRAGGTCVGVLEFFTSELREPNEQQKALLLTVAPQIAEYLARRRAEERAARDKDAFVAMVSHELRTPLTSITGFAQTALDQRASLDRTALDEFFEVILAQGRRLTKIVDDLLTVSAIRSRGVEPDLTEVDLAATTRETLAELGYDDRFQVEVRGDEPVVACADPDLCKQVLVNLTTNALRYGAAPYRVELASEDGTARVVVSDSGDGVPPEFEPKLFERFARAGGPQAGPGTGLGLAIVRSIVEAQDGRVWHERREPRGARFVVELPRSP